MLRLQNTRFLLRIPPKLKDGLRPAFVRQFHSSRSNFRNFRPSPNLYAAVSTSAIFGAAYLIDMENVVRRDQSAAKRPQFHLSIRKDLPTYRREQIREHNSLEKGVWVTYGIGVYDITKFIPQHPGSEKVMLAAGEAVEPFWHTYQQHNTIEVLRLLETFRIGNLPPEEAGDTSDLYDPWVNEPKRSPVLIVASERPFNAEPPMERLVEHFQTPNELFYVRNHLPVPEVDARSYELEVVNEKNKKTIVLTLDRLKKYKEATVTAAVMCGGNRRAEMMRVGEVKGLKWCGSAVGNAQWTGVRLVDVLRDLGVESNDTDHVHFEGLDMDPTYTPYAASIPLSKAMDPRGDVLLAYRMNGEPLSRDHGWPLRVIVPGVVGARNVKWLVRIVITREESNSHWQQKDYKGFSPSTDWATVRWDSAPAIQNMPVTSAICTPAHGTAVPVRDGCIEVRGYAWSGGGARIVRVDLTTDEGRTWHVAELEQDKEQPNGRHWGWTLWTARLPVDPKAKEAQIWAKAVDSNYNVQPETFENIFNFRGVLSNAYHRIKVKLTK